MLLAPPPGAQPEAKNPKAMPPVRPRDLTTANAAWINLNYFDSVKIKIIIIICLYSNQHLCINIHTFTTFIISGIF